MNFLYVNHIIDHTMKHTVWRDIFKGQISMVFTDLPQTVKILTVKFYPQRKPYPFPAIGVA